MKFAIALSLLIAGALAADYKPTPPQNPITGTTPPPVDCPNVMCSGKADGNYPYDNYGVKKPNYFTQCVGGSAFCQACFPMKLVYSKKCNQCLYAEHDECHTTKSYAPQAPIVCPDLCPQKGYDFDGNIKDPERRGQYVACWKGVTAGCIRCPANLLFNEEKNACMYDGKHMTKPY